MVDLVVHPGGRADVALDDDETGLPPHDEGAEMSVVLSAMIDPGKAAEAVALLREEHFFCRRHRMTFRAIATLAASGQPTDIVSVLAWLRTDGRLGEWGSAAEFTRSLDGCIGVTSMDRAAAIIRDAWRMREVEVLARLVIAQVRMRYEAQELLDKLSAHVFALAGDTPAFTWQDSKSLASEVSRKIIAASSPTATSAGMGFGVVSGFRDFDAKVLPFIDGSMTIVAARPGVGKTSFLLAVAVAAAERGEPVYFATCEMPKDQLMLRCACMRAGVSYQDVAMNRTGKAGSSRLFDALAHLSTLPIIWDSLTAPTVPEVRTKVERVKAEQSRKGRPLRIVVVDYMGKMRAVGLGPRATEQEAAANIAVNCKNAAKKTELPWLIAAQLNRRGVEGGKVRRPQVTDIRGSGVIENEADTILLIHRDDHAKEQMHGDGQTATREALVIVGKQRNGSSPTIALRFIREFARFEDADVIS